VEFVNSTISDNHASQGGGIDDSGGVSSSGRFASFMSILNSTVSHNAANGVGGGLYHRQHEGEDWNTGLSYHLTMVLENTIVSDNVGGNCGGDVADEYFVSNGHNLSSDASCPKLSEPGDLTKADPQLGPLQDNGGPTETRAIAQESPAVDAANNSTCPTTDQRRFTRPNGPGCDIGAYEYMPEGTVLWVNPLVLAFQTSAGGGPVSQSIGIGNPEELPASWTASEEIAWLTLAATSGSSMPALLDVTVDPGSLDEGIYNGQIAIASPELGDSPQTVDVSLIVGSPNFPVYLPLVGRAWSGGGGSCAPNPPGESDNVWDAIAVCSGQTVSGQVGLGDLDDVFKIPLASGQQLTISMNGSGPGDADLYLYPPGTTDVTTNPYSAASTNGSNDELIQGTVQTGGEWYIDVHSYDGGQVDYNVTVTVSDPGAGTTGIQTLELDPDQGVKDGEK
jgi:hypothetical protein